MPSGLKAETTNSVGSLTGSELFALSNWNRSTGAVARTTAGDGGNSRELAVDGLAGKTPSEKVRAGGKDCNASDLAVRAVKYRAGAGASHPAQFSDDDFDIDAEPPVERFPDGEFDE